MTLPNVLKPENIKRLMEIDQRLYIMEFADRMLREEQNERAKLIAEKERLLCGDGK